MPKALLVIAMLTASVLAGSTVAAGASDRVPLLRGAPQLRIIDGHHAKLSFDSDPLALVVVAITQ